MYKLYNPQKPQEYKLANTELCLSQYFKAQALENMNFK